MSSSSLDCCPAFFKVYLPEFCSRHLHIPPAFESHIKGELPSTVRLCRGKNWNVKIQTEEDEDGLFFKEGWSKFVQDNALEIGEFLVFYYDQPNSSFTVKLFDRNFCEKKRKFIAMADSDGIAAASPLTTKVDVKREEFPDDEDLQTCNCRSKKTATKLNGALEKANLYKPKHPSFRAVLSQSYVTGRSPFLYIPSSFWRKYIEQNSRAELQHLGKCWKVEIYNQNSSGRITNGWAEFVRDNELRVGDVCIFELINSDAIVFEISIFRQDPR